MSSMPDKRKPSASNSGSSPYAKRPRPFYAEGDDEDNMTPAAVTPYERPRNHPLYGQKGAFPGLDTPADDELFYGPADDGMEYLRMVRSEANSLPFTFSAPPQATEPPVEQPAKDEDEEGKQGEEKISETMKTTAYVNGNNTASSSTGAGAVPPDIAEITYSDAQASYYNLLRHRFLLLRSILKCSPPSTAIADLDDSHPISLPRHSKNARKEWRRLLLAVDPQTVQLACMDMESVLGVLGIMARLMSENMRSGDASRVRRIGAWAWGLLGKCREVGQLGTEEVGEIRELGKRAVKILRKMREEEDAKSQPVGEDGGDLSNEESDDEENVPEDSNGQVEERIESEAPAEAPDQEMPDAAEKEPSVDELEQAKARLQAKLQDTEKEQPSNEPQSVDPEVQEPESSTESTVEVGVQTRAMLDMIITVVGEYYGQRDLLEARELWDESAELV